MPVVAAPAFEEMPRIEISEDSELLLLALRTKLIPGVRREMSSIVRVPCTSIVACEKAVMLIGTFCNDSSRRYAVTTISSRASADVIAGVIGFAAPVRVEAGLVSAG